MPPIEEEHVFTCPYCSTEISITVDCAAGRRQSFTSDCEVCCRPIAIRMEVESHGMASFSAERES